VTFHEKDLGQVEHLWQHYEKSSDSSETGFKDNMMGTNKVRATTLENDIHVIQSSNFFILNALPAFCSLAGISLQERFS
jgi:hypothetical protein